MATPWGRGAGPGAAASPGLFCLLRSPFSFAGKFRLPALEGLKGRKKNKKQTNKKTPHPTSKRVVAPCIRCSPRRRSAHPDATRPQRRGAADATKGPLDPLKAPACSSGAGASPAAPQPRLPSGPRLPPRPPGAASVSRGKVPQAGARCGMPGTPRAALPRRSLHGLPAKLENHCPLPPVALGWSPSRQRGKKK